MQADGYDGVISTHRYTESRAQKVGFLYKRSDIELVESYQIFRNNRFSFPRPPVLAKFKRLKPIPGFSDEFTAIVVHLKAMGDEKSRLRRTKANLLLEKFVAELREGRTH